MTTRQPETTAEPAAPRSMSINEPPGSNVFANPEDGPSQIPPEAIPPLVLSDIDPDSIVVGSAADFVLTITGSGFGPETVVLFDDEEYPTAGNQTTLTATIPVAAAPGVVDVEVARGEEMSDVLTFEFVAPAGRRVSDKAERKPKKEEPRGKRSKKDKQPQKGRR